MISPLITELIEALRCLPGVGPKSAQRMAFQLLDRQRDNGHHLAQTLEKTLQAIGNCQQCRNFSETDLCPLCRHPNRDNTLLCIVESPLDVLAIEQTASFKGRYFVLRGHLSPLDGVGPNDLGIDLLEKRMNAENFSEIIIATNTTVEGEATAHYIATLTQRHNLSCSRIAHGVPMGGELEYLDGHTLTRALFSRTEINLTQAA